MRQKIKAFAKAFKKELKVYRSVLGDKRTPWMAKFCLGLAVAYVLMPFDLLPDFIPVIGQLDDLLIVPLLVYLAIKIIPDDLLAEHRLRVEHEL